MKRATKLFGLLAAVLVGTALTPIREAGAAAIPKDARYVPGEVVVVMRGASRTSTALTQARSLARQVGGRVTRVSGRSRAAVIRTADGGDVPALARRLSQDPRVRIAEPNYIYRASGVEASAYVARRAPGGGKTLVSKAALRAMRTRTSAGIKATYPTDRLAFDNAGWDHVGASIVWNNTTPSVNVCVIDTGVDYLHTDLTTLRVIKGPDFVNEDLDPMDDNGHGTHVAGIIAAKQNNTEGIAGVSPTAKVYAVKALNASGWGTNYDIWQAIDWCSLRTPTQAKIINMSFGGPYSMLLEKGVRDAQNRGKLMVAAAGNENSDMPECTPETSAIGPVNLPLNPPSALAAVRSYPAGFAVASSQYAWDAGLQTCTEAVDSLHDGYDAVLSVGAGGMSQYDDLVNYSCKAEDSNYGDWVSVAAPGTDILSTTPWDKPFTLMRDVDFRYGALSGTSAAAAFVSGVAARVWGFADFKAMLNVDLGHQMQATVSDVEAEMGFILDAAGGTCWPESMDGKVEVNVAKAMRRGGLTVEAIDAVTGLPLVGAVVQAYQSTATAPLASAVVSSVKQTFPPDPTTYLSIPAQVDLINLDCRSTTLKVNKAGYTVGSIAAVVGDELSNADGTIEVPEGEIWYAGYAAVPPRSARFTAVAAWPKSDLWKGLSIPKLTTSLPDKEAKSNTALWDGQLYDFVVGHDVCDSLGLDGDPAGELKIFPNAQLIYQVGDFDEFAVETHVIQDRKALPGVAANAAQPQWTGDYVFRLRNPIITPTPENPDPPDLGGFAGRKGSFFIWKDGYLKTRVDLDPANPTCDESADWWEAAKLSAAKTGSATYPPTATVSYPEKNTCMPESAVDFPVMCP